MSTVYMPSAANIATWKWNSSYMYIEVAENWIPAMIYITYAPSDIYFWKKLLIIW